ncbi:pyridoxamine 5'-phosphate oxidase family protein [Bacillus suaedaesalsae]|uniref:Pyridoxamine 5'-phosphate oxidase family protein n=1 Tax=Bacillus suaedaesalsae TaxID=2810349 RepID=A0ABS2DM79_9BACI|nr:pyridoxamine 5'-phosphate oxidase family protein [Bacillus suaedaesalsae]MBM6619574.1 pyridoxamine 5'-phosphate oxidase family protein [Bacillus suaedaesalsae]
MVNFMLNDIISTKDELRTLLGEPSQRAEAKVIHKLDDHCRTILAHSPFLVLSTSNEDGTCDASPRGDAPGFVYVIDDHHIVIPERPGNKRIDSLQNIVSNPHVGLLFMIPGMEETLRLNGKAYITRNEDLLEKMEVGQKIPQLGIIVKIEEIYIHCAKALIRSKLWSSETWPNRKELPTMATIVKAHAELKESTVEIEESLQESYTTRLY